MLCLCSLSAFLLLVMLILCVMFLWSAAGNEQTLSLLLDVGHQDVNSVCFNSFTALDYINSTLAWLEEGGDRLGYFADMGLQFASAGDEEGRRVVR